MAFDSARGVMNIYGGAGGVAGSPHTWGFDDEEGKWVLQATSGPTAIGSFASCFDSARQVMVLFGGISASPDVNLSGETWEWNGATWTLKATTGPAPRLDASMAFDEERGVSVLFGGDLTFPQGGENGETWEWDGETWTQRAVTGPEPRTAQRMAYDLLRDVIVLYGGSSWSNGVTTYFQDTWEFEGRAGVWTRTTAAALPVSVNHAMCFDGLSNTVLVFGGYAPPNYLDQTWSWDGKTWALLADDGPPPRRHHAMAFDSQRQVVVMTGGETSGEYLSDTWEWDGRAWSIAAHSPSPRVYHGMAYDSQRQAGVLFGGNVKIAQLSDETWEWFQDNGESGVWIRRDVPGPAARQRHAMTFFEDRGVTVLFGGTQGGNETWEWDGTKQSWTQRMIPGPASRHSHAMVYDSARQVVVLFGGAAGGSFGDTWEYDGAQWIQVATDGPSPRYLHAMAYDPLREVTVLFGGHDNPAIPNGISDETWEFDGNTSTWTQREATGPPAREGHAMTYDVNAGKVVMFGGMSGGGHWEWDGSKWESQGVGYPTNRLGHSMIYDSLNQHAIVFGGQASAKLGDTWALRRPPAGDVNCDDSVNVDDLLAIINAWGPCASGSECPADLTGNGIVDVDDLLMVINNWTT